MSQHPQVFVDSDVVISSLLSQSGAAYLLLHTNNLGLFISNISQRELAVVIIRLALDLEKLRELEKERLSIVVLETFPQAIENTYAKYVTDLNDAHIVAGAAKANVKFLITYNIKDYKIDKIKQDLDIVVLTPARFLQYLRSRN